MSRMSEETVERLRAAVTDPTIVSAYRSHIALGEEDSCDLWTGAISGRGHGRFAIGSEQIGRPGAPARRRTFTVIAHRFGYALVHGVDVMLAVPVIAHWWCDNPLCQKPEHWQASTAAQNRAEYIARRDAVLHPLADVRGARGRARAVRDAAREGADVAVAMDAGTRPVHRDQLSFFDLPWRRPRPEDCESSHR